VVLKARKITRYFSAKWFITSRISLIALAEDSVRQGIQMS
jgi:hypothetical protein